jgi:predicted DNA-binding ribbon-helix-helix protein
VSDSIAPPVPGVTPATTGPEDILIAAAEPQFRTVTTATGRAGIRIEKVFWDSLSDISEALGIKRSALVGTVIERAKAGDLNVASALRSYVAAVHRGETERLKGLLSTAQVAKQLQLAPVPSFALTRQKRLISANAEFVQYLRGIPGDPANSVSPEVAQLSLDRPIEDVFEELKSEGASVRCVLTIRVDNRNRRAACKIVAVPPLPAQAIVGYLLGRVE